MRDWADQSSMCGDLVFIFLLLIEFCRFFSVLFRFIRCIEHHGEAF